MSKKTIFSGVGTALITPFNDEKIDYESLALIIENQIECDIDALIVGGTTGEAATLRDEERYELYKKAKEIINGRCKLILGAGTNDTSVAIRHAEFCSQLGCDGILVVTPYYNKGTKRGIIKHYTMIAEHSSAPIILYNVPSRTGVNLGIDVLRELSQIPMINALKEASDSVNRLVEISSLTDSLDLYAGNDTQIYPTLALGGKGVISAVSNIYPKEIKDICKLFFANKQKCSLKLQQRMFEAINVLFTETNPTPIKYAMWKKGYCKNELRLPLYPAAPSTEKMIDTVMEELDSVNFK